eukprot:evm.model.scf_457.5 EVM.evm.TU.scf_457.5   scf_457:69372-78580(-)
MGEEGAERSGHEGDKQKPDGDVPSGVEGCRREGDPAESSGGDGETANATPDPGDGGVADCEQEAPEDADGAEKKNGKKKKKRKKGKKFVPLPILAVLEEHLPWKMNFSQKLGRHAVATRDIAVGELVLVERAVAAVPREHLASSVCHWCFRKQPEVKMVVHGDNRMYCSHRCIQESARWGSAAAELHSAVPTVARDTNCDSSLLTMVVELESLKERRPSGGLQVRSADDRNGKNGIPEHGAGEWWKDGKDELTVCAGWEDVQALVVHWEKMHEAWRKSVTAACKALLPIMAKAYPHRKEATLQELQELAATVNSNTHGVGQMTGGDNTDVAIGLFPVLSLCNHSCRPNCCFHADGSVVCMRAATDIKQGEVLSVSYINLFEPRWLRARLLLDTRYFNCTCSRCSEPIASSTDRLLEGVRCARRKCRGLLLANRSRDVPEDISHWQCNECSAISGRKEPDENQAEGANRGGGDGMPDPQECVDNAHQSLQIAITLYQQRQLREAMLKLEEHLKEFDVQGRLSPMHVHLFDSWTPMMNCSRRMGDAQSSIKYCQKVIQAMETILDVPTIELGNYYMCLGEMLGIRAAAINLASAIRDIHKKQAQEALRKALNLRKVCLGIAHPATQETLAALRKL